MKGLKKHSTAIIGCIVVIIVIVIGAFILISHNSQKAAQEGTVIDNSVQTLSPSAIGLKLEASSDKKEIRFTISNASDIKDIEYELTYVANSTAEERSEGSDARVQRGITGDETIHSGSSTYQSSWLILGSQSANIVRYDTGVKSVAITLKVTKTDNKVYQVQDSLNL